MPSAATATGSLLIACDGIHSVARRHFYPDEGMPKWNGSLLWRGLAEGPPVFDGRTMIVGRASAAEVRRSTRCSTCADGRQQLNFIAELRTDSTELVEREDWNKPGDLADFLPQFEGWVFPWLDVPVADPVGTRHVPVPDGRSRSRRPLVVRPRHPARATPRTRCTRSAPTARRRRSSTPGRSPVACSATPDDVERALAALRRGAPPGDLGDRPRQPRARPGAADAARRGARPRRVRPAVAT